MKSAALSKNLLLGVAVLLSACAVGPDYERPDASTPTNFKELGEWDPAHPMDDVDRGAWWHVYKDPILDKLEQQVDVSNQNLKAAEAAYRQASAVVDETNASLFPTISLSGGGARSKAVGNTRPTNNMNAGANAAWTPDLWGSIRRTLESDEANAEASAADLASARLSAQGTLATTYFELRVQDELIRLLNATVEADKKALQIVKNQYEAGVAAKADVLAAETQLQTVQSSAINANVNRLKYEHAIAVLVGMAPADFNLEPVKLVYRIPKVPVDVPSTLLERRPDIASAERLMAAANAEIGAETAAWYPNLTLSASYGYSGAMFSKLLQASNSVWSVGPTVAETIFDAGARDARIAEATAAYDESVATYRQTVLNSFQEVEDNLGSLRVLAEQAKVANASVIDARKSEMLTMNQYKLGVVPYSSVLTAETTSLANEETALQVYNDRLVASVGLIQALGGGWDTKQLDHPILHDGEHKDDDKKDSE